MSSLKLCKSFVSVKEKNGTKKNDKMYTDFAELPIMLNANNLAAIMQISRAGAYNLFRLDGFPTNKVNGRALVLKSDLIQWLQQNKR